MVAEVPQQVFTRAEFLQRVWDRNENIQIRALESAATDERWRAEKGIFEPEFTSSIEAVDRRRANTQEQAASSSFSRVFNERNRTYQTGLESLIQTGGRVRLGYNVQHLENSFHSQPPPNLFGAPLGTFENGEYMTTFGLNLTQPLLKGGWSKVTMAGIRASAIQSQITFQAYRKGLMEVMIRAEAAYWDLHQAQEQLTIAGESLRIAQTLLADSKKRLEVGKGAELDVLQAEAGVETRKALEHEARLRLADAQSRAATFLAESWTQNQIAVTAKDKPVVRDHTPTFGELWAEVYEMNPDYVSVIKQAELEGVRVVVAKNQRLPQLDLTGGYGVSRVSSNAGKSLNVAQRQDFPSWSVGIQLKVPLTGGKKAAHEFKAAELRAEATRLQIENLGTQLANSVRAAIAGVESYQRNSTRYQRVVDVNAEVLKNQLALLEGGKAGSRVVLEAEEDLFRARISSLENTMRYLRSELDLEFLVGAALKNRNLEFTMEELRDRTEELTRSGRLTPERYEQFLQEMRDEYEVRQRGATGGVQP